MSSDKSTKNIEVSTDKKTAKDKNPEEELQEKSEDSSGDSL